jgi:hypothetical protein
VRRILCSGKRSARSEQEHRHSMRSPRDRLHTYYTLYLQLLQNNKMNCLSINKTGFRLYCTGFFFVTSFFPNVMSRRGSGSGFTLNILGWLWQKKRSQQSCSYSIQPLLTAKLLESWNSCRLDNQPMGVR